MFAQSCKVAATPSNEEMWDLKRLADFPRSAILGVYTSRNSGQASCPYARVLFSTVSFVESELPTIDFSLLNFQQSQNRGSPVSAQAPKSMIR